MVAFINMGKIEEHVSQKILHEIIIFEPKISIDFPNPSGVLKSVLAQNPEVSFYITSINIADGKRYGSYSACLSYSNEDIAPNQIFVVDSLHNVDGVLHNSIGKCYKKVVLMSVDSRIQNVISDFITNYSAYYSNLVGIEYCARSVICNESMVAYVLSFSYRIGKVKLNMMNRSVEEEVKNLGTKLFDSLMSDTEKALIAHNYLAKTVEYCHKEAANPLERSYMQSAYGALINHKCVCQGYAEAYKKLMNSQDVFCEVVCGKIRNSTEHHAWNIIGVDKTTYFHVDVTWDSKGAGHFETQYFGLGDSDLSGSRLWVKPFGISCRSSRDVLIEAKSRLLLKRTEYCSRGVDITRLI